MTRRFLSWASLGPSMGEAAFYLFGTIVNALEIVHRIVISVYVFVTRLFNEFSRTQHVLWRIMFEGNISFNYFQAIKRLGVNTLSAKGKDVDPRERNSAKRLHSTETKRELCLWINTETHSSCQ